MTTTWRLAIAGVATSGLLLVAGAPALAQQLDTAVSAAEQATEEAAASQARIDNLANQTGDLFREYRATLQRIDSQQLFVEQQRVYLRSQESEIADLERQITEVGDVLRNLLPMQVQMINELAAFVDADIPFKRPERLARIARLRTYMDDPSISPAERYRQIVEAFQIEADAGRFLDTWSAPFIEDPLSDADPDPDAPTVDYLLIGRVAFVYMTQDESQMGIWNEQSGAWTPLPSSFRLDIRSAIRMAKEVTSPDVFMAPVYGATMADGSQG